MDHNLLHLSARIRAFCIALALLLLPGAMQAEDVYLLTAENINGTTGNYNVPSNHKFANTSGTEYTYTITSMPATGFSFRIGVKGWDKDMQPYTDGDALTIGGSYTISENCWGKDKAWKVSYTEGEYKSLTITVDVSTSNRYVKITGVKSSTGGGTSTTCAPGLYIAGDKYGKTGDQYIYKLQRNKDKQYYISLNAINGAEWSNVQSYDTGNGIDNYKISTIGQTYHLVYVDDQGNETNYYPSTNGYTFTGSDTNTGSNKTNKFSTTSSNWTIGVLNSADKNGGIYNFYVNTDVNGVPQNWYYEADQTKVVAYEVNESTHTTDAYLYCSRSTTTAEYNKNFFGMVSFVKDGYLSFLFADKTYGRRKNSNSNYDQDAAADSPNAFQFSKDHLDTGIYTTEFNPTRDYIISGDMKPTRIFIIGSALNSNLSDNFTEWDPSNATEMVYDVDEGCYKATVTLTKDKHFRFLLDHNESGAATSLDNNFGEDDHKPGSGDDTDYNNKVQVESSSTSGSNITFNPVTDTYVVRFYVERKADKQGFQWTNDYGIYRYTIEKPERLNATITPTTATVNYAASLTPKVSVVGTTAAKRKYAFTIDGSNPTIDPATGKATGKTFLREYDYDAVVPTNDVYTFYMSSADQLTYIDLDGNEHTLKSNTVTVKAQAVQTITDGSKYRLEGDIATGTYVFKTAGIKPAGSNTISVKNDDETYNTTGKPSINKVTATVTVKNEKGEDDGVDVFYTIDGSDPAAVGNPGARLVKDRKINVYGIAYLEQGAENKIRVAIAGSKETEKDDGTTHASCKFDLTCSTSEGGYKTYRENNTDTNLKIYGGDGHIVVYIMPWTSKYGTKNDDGRIWVQSSAKGYQSPDDTPIKENNVKGFRVPFIYAYENIVNKDGVVESKALTHATHTIDVFTDVAEGLPTQKNKDNADAPDYNWHYVDLVPDKDYKEVNLEVGYYDLITGKWEFTPATIANVHNDMFLMYDVATGQIKDVTHEFTGDHFYTIGEGGTKSEAANPAIGEHFFYAQVPEAWTINGNSVKVLQNGNVLDGVNVDVQGSAETSCLSKVCKISVPATLAENTSLTIQPYHGDKASGQKWTVNYVNGGYYFYESDAHYTTNAPLVFSADATGDHDQRPKGHLDINHTLETTPGVRVKKIGYRAYGDCTYYLSPKWDYTPTTESPTITVKDNWNGKEATVNTIADGTTISQTVKGLTMDGDQYTVQMIVRGTPGAKATLELVGSNDDGEDESVGDDSGDTKPIGNASTASVSKTFAGYDAQGTVTTDGRVEHLLKTDTKNGWQKLETVASVGEGGTLTISLKAEGGELQLSDVTLLCNANTPPVTDESHPDIIPTIWTSAPTNNDVTEYDLTDRRGANAFSFFDRGDNRNAVIYADKNTVLGMSEKTYNVAVTNASTNAKGSLFSKESSSVSSGNESGYTMNKLVLTDQAQDGTTAAGDVEKFYASGWNYGTTHDITANAVYFDRTFSAGVKAAVCFPFSLTQKQLEEMFGTGAKAYSITNVDADKLEVTFAPATGDYVVVANTPCLIEPGRDYSASAEVAGSFSLPSTSRKMLSTTAGSGYTFNGTYEYKTVYFNKDEHCYSFEPTLKGRFKYVSKSKGGIVKPFRAYIKENDTSSPAKVFNLVIDNTVTNIEEYKFTEASNAPIYSITGVLVSASGNKEGLAKGIYLQNGKKFIITK